MQCLAGVTLAVNITSALGDELSGFDCLIEPYALAEVSTREEGVLETLLVDRGDLVTKNQVLVRLDADIEEATVALAKAKVRLSGEIQERRENLRFLKQEHERLVKLQVSNAVSFRDIDKAATEERRAALQLRQAIEQEQLAKLDLVRAEALLARRTIHSPFNGTVVETVLTPGESVQDRTIMKIAQIDPLKVEVIVPVTYYGAVEVGMKARVTPQYPGATEHVATVAVVDRVVDAASDTFGVRLDLANADMQIPGGVRCDIEFLQKRGDVSKRAAMAQPGNGERRTD